MICIYCGTDNPDRTIFCPNCGGLQASEASSTQSSEASAQVTSPKQQSVSEQPTLRQQSNIPESTLPLSEDQLWATVSADTSADQQPLPDKEMSSEIPTMPAIEPKLPTDNQVTTGPLSTTRTPWTRVLETRFGVLARPLPLWVTIITIAVVVLILIALQLTGSDWAAGAMHVALAAGIIGLLIALAIGVRTLTGMRRLHRYILPGLAVIALLMLSGVGLTQQSPIHRLQGSSLEGQKQWERALTEFQLAGEGQPASDNIARTYVEWGEQLSTGHQYEATIVKLDMVLLNYGSATREVVRAQSDEIVALLAWGKQAMQQQDYANATIRFDGLLNQSYCNSDCQVQASALDASAYYKLAETQLTAQQNDNAVNNFQVVLNRFPYTPEAKQLHPDLAQAILGQGQQQLASDCSSAIPTYQQLSTQFADTPAGQQATKALHAPQPVTGRFVGSIPNNSSLTPVVFLAKNLDGTISPNAFEQALIGVPTETIHNDGTFRFKAVSQGTYDLAWGTNRNDGAFYHRFAYNTSDNTPTYVATIGQLCPFDFSDINEDIPTPP